MKLRRKVYVLGGAHTPFIGKHHPDFVWKRHPDFGLRENPTIEEHLHAATNQAFANTGVDPAQVERGFVGNFTGECFVQQGHLGAMLSGAHPDLAGKPFARVEAACASGGLAVVWAVDSIQAGYDVLLATGVEVQTNVSARVGAEYLARACDFARQRDIDPFTFPCLFARRAKAYMESFGATHEDLAHVVVKAYGNANRNPYAHMRERRVDLEWAGSASDANPTFLSNEEFKEYMKFSDCSQVSDGASAMILASEEGLRRLGKSPDDAVELVSYGHSTNPLVEPDDLTRLQTTERAVAEAFGDAGVSPHEIEIAEVHDCFSVSELMMIEALGLAKRGQAAAFTRAGESSLTGSVPINSGGGLLAFGHPVGATGVKQVLELSRQMRGQSGDYQVSSNPRVGVSANMGGDDRTAVVTVLRV